MSAKQKHTDTVLCWKELHLFWPDTWKYSKMHECKQKEFSKDRAHNTIVLHRILLPFNVGVLLWSLIAKYKFPVKRKVNIDIGMPYLTQIVSVLWIRYYQNNISNFFPEYLCCVCVHLVLSTLLSMNVNGVLVFRFLALSIHLWHWEPHQPVQH